MKTVLGCAVAGAIGVGAAGFAFGASIPDGRAGEAAVTLAWMGALAGAVLGALVGALVSSLAG